MPCSLAVDAHISDLADVAVAVDPQTKAVSPARAVVVVVVVAETLAAPQSAVDETRSCAATYLN